MNKKYVFAGVLLSAFLHLTFFTMPNLLGGKKIEIPKGISENCPIEARIPEEPKREEVKGVTAKEPEKKIENMEEVFKPDSVEMAAVTEEEGSIKVEERTDEYMPALRMDISDRKAILGAVKYFRMKIVLMDGLGNFADEIDIKWFDKIVPIQEELSGYSNRIRMLPEGFFGEKVERTIKMRGLKPCILVPAETDRKFAEIQKKAIGERGYDLDEVRITAGRFVEGPGGYSLKIEKLYLITGKEDFL